MGNLGKEERDIRKSESESESERERERERVRRRDMGKKKEIWERRKRYG